jgi:hypothetical protein
MWILTVWNTQIVAPVDRTSVWVCAWQELREIESSCTVASKYAPIVVAPDDNSVWSIGEMILPKGTSKFLDNRRTCPRTTLLTTNPTWTILSLNPSLRDKKSVIRCVRDMCLCVCVCVWRLYACLVLHLHDTNPINYTVTCFIIRTHHFISFSSYSFPCTDWTLSPVKGKGKVVPVLN